MNKLLHVVLLLCISATLTTAQINLTNGLVAYYPFSGSFNDASGTGNHGTGMNGVTFGTDQWGNANSAAFFDGSNDWISVPASASLTPGHHLSISLRFKTNSSALQLLVSKSDYSGSNAPHSMQYQVGLNAGSILPNNGLLFSTAHTNTCITPSFYTSNYSYGSLVNNNQWYCVVVTFNNGVKKVYMNGSLISTVTISGTANNTSIDSCINGTLRMGVWWQNDPRYFSGLMDEVRIWNRTINQQEIDSICNLLPVPKDTVINKYAAIIGRGDCDNSFFVDTATDFAAGDTVLMIQMKGAGIDTSNSASFGSVTNYNGAGNYELNVIKAVSGNNIALQYKLQRQYNIPGGKVQFVRVPSYSNYTVTQTHTCFPWTGSKGGVFIVNVANTLSLNADIDVSGKGFTGGQISHATVHACNRPDYFYPLSGSDGGQKGEGIAQVSSFKMAGKGRLANGGGGGNNANAGGGGGSNVGSGGVGGYQHLSCSQSLASGGLGGAGLTLSAVNNRLYSGGGGGAGHENNANTDPGGNGAGIIIITAATLAGNGNYIKANGLSCIDNNASKAIGGQGDGQSGGGAGGSVLLKVNSFIAAPIVEAKGGAGGNMYATTVHGPGGGGGGGCVLFSSTTLSSANINVSGGANGTLVKMGNSAHNAQPGQAGQTVSSVPFAMPITIYQPNQITIGFTDTFLTCTTRQFISTVSTTSTGVASYQWSFGTGTSSLKNPIFTFPGGGTYPVRLIVTDSNGCRDSLIKSVFVTYPRFATATGDTGICLGTSAVLSATGGGTYSWNPATSLSNPAAAVTTATPIATTSYVVTVTNAEGCIDMDTVTVTIIQSPTPITAFPSDTVICHGKELQLGAVNGTSYQWWPSAGLSNVHIANPIATITGDIQYTVWGKDISGCISSDTVNIQRAPDPVVNASSDGRAISCDHAGVMLYASGAATYAWSPIAYVSDGQNDSTLASPPNTTVFTLTGYDSIGCMSSDTITVFAFAKAPAFVPDAFTPNGDGRNDRLRAIAYCDFELAEFRIFNRWGECVFYGFTGEHAWDGTNKGEPVPLGAYFYFIRGKKPSTGEEVFFKGNVTLLR